MLCQTNKKFVQYLSLALALGLLSFSSHNHHEESLFIDEGFDTLDTDTLQIVMEVLKRLLARQESRGLFSMSTKRLNVSRFKSMFIKPEMGKVKSK